MSKSGREGRSDNKAYFIIRTDFLRLLGRTPLPQETQEEWEKWVCEPIIKYPLAPRQAKAALELLGYLSSYGINIDKILIDLAREQTKRLRPRPLSKKSELKSKTRRKIR